MINLEAERAVLGALMLDGSLYDQISDKIGAMDFGDTTHQAIWRAMTKQSAAGNPLDLVTVTEVLETDGHLDAVGGMAYLAEVARETPSASNAMAYADIVADMALRRRLGDELSNIDTLARDKSRSAESAVDDALARISRLIREDSDHAGPIRNDLEDMLDTLDRKWNGEENPMGLSFGLTDLDKQTLGMHPGQYILVGGRPSMGKTAFALNALRKCCVTDMNPGLIFSMEMDRHALRDRLSAAVADIPFQAIKDPRKHMTDENWAKLPLAINGLKTAPLIVDDRAGMTPAQIRSAAKRWRDHYGRMGIVVIDYLQLMRGDDRRNGREQEVAEASRTMKLMAKELQCPVIVLSQLNRSLEQRTNKRPTMSDLRESGSLEQDADIILFLYRDEIYNPDNEHSQGVAEIIIGKQRDGSTGTVYAKAQLDRMQFLDLDFTTIQRMHEERDAPPKRKGGMAEI